MRRLLPVLVLLAGLVAAPAQACGGHQFYHGVIHNGLPSPLPTGAWIAEVEFDADAAPGDLYGSGLRARVVRVIQGDFRGETVLARRRAWTSCSSPFTNGRTGLIVAVPLGLDDGEMVVDPIEVGRSRGFRLSDGFQLLRPR